VNTYSEDDLRAALAHEADAGRPPSDVWPHLHRRIVVRRRVRAGVAAAALGVVAAAVVVALPNHQDSVTVPPATGGGTTTLVPDHPLTDSALGTAVDILRHRLDVLGVSGAELSTHDGEIEVNAPGLSSDEVAAIAVRGVLQFRLVDSRQAADSCPNASGEIPATAGAIACSAEGATQYTLGSVALDNSDIKSADVVQNTNTGGWLVQVTFDSAGAGKWHTLTAAAAGGGQLANCQPHDCNAIAFILDGTVIEAPSVEQQGGIAGGETQIVTGASTKEAAQVVAALAVTSPLTTAFSVS
jgi:preprotein translocase subunit SecD